MKPKFQLLLILFFSLPATVTSQQSLLQGEWRDHLSYLKCNRIAEVNEWIFCAAQSGMLSYNKNTHELRTHSTATGLSDVQVSTITYSPETNYLIVGYVNGNIDLLRENEKPLNISDIKRRIITADKRINGIFTYGKTAYLSCCFVIVVLNLDRL